MERRFYRYWGNGGGGDFRVVGVGCIVNGSFDLGRFCFWRYCGDVFRLCLCAFGGELF